jgi:hypothetical protein
MNPFTKVHKKLTDYLDKKVGGVLSSANDKLEKKQIEEYFHIQQLGLNHTRIENNIEFIGDIKNRNVKITGVRTILIKETSKLPCNIVEITGDLEISHCKLITLEGCPEKVNESFFCNENELKSLEHGPKFVKDKYQAQFNPLTTLEFLPIEAGTFCVSYGDKLQLLRLFIIKCNNLILQNETPNHTFGFLLKSNIDAANLLNDVQNSGLSKKGKILKFQKGLIDLGLPNNAVL